jgi:hypothetical protein
MLTLGAVAFAAPWALGMLAVAPLLWWLLRVLPPSPRRQIFPPLALLLGLAGREDSTARTPWWVLALRLVVMVLLVLAAAQPLLHPAAPAGSAAMPLVLVVDDGWAAAADWPARLAHAGQVLDQAERAGRPVRLLSAAPPAVLEPSDVLSAGQARTRLQALQPKPWPVDRAALLKAIKALPRDQVTQAVWICDGIEDGAGGAVARALQTLGGGLDLVVGASPLLLLPPAEGGAADLLTVRLRRPKGIDRAEPVMVRALDGRGRVVGRAEARLEPGQGETEIDLRLPSDLRNAIARLDVAQSHSAAATVLLDERWQRRPVGLAALDEAAVPLLAPLYYVERGLAPFADLHHGDIGSLIDHPVAVLVLADVPTPTPGLARRLTEWVEGGGVLLRFAGPQTARAVAARGPADPLLAVRLRDGGRALGGAMSWTVPQGLAPFPSHGPLAGLRVPDDVRVASQVLAEPDGDLAERSWASLADGTPLVTGRRQGKGWVVLIHTTANAEWSNLPLSGLFVDLLRHLTRLAVSQGQSPGDGPLSPLDVLDGFGRLSAPGPQVTARPADAPPGPHHPPGYYGRAGSRVAVNLAPLLPVPALLVPPPGVHVSTLGMQPGERDLRPHLLVAALGLALLDLLIALALRGLLRRAAAAAVVGLAAFPAMAAEPPPPDAALAMRLAWVRTGLPEIDRKSAAGLKALSKLVGQRSTAVLAAPAGIDPETDPVLFYPILYWPVTPSAKPPSAAAVTRLNAYLRAGGMIVFETGADGDGSGLADPAPVRALTADLQVPPLVPAEADHVLTRSFYLLKDLPGRWVGPAWVATAGSGGQDGVSPLVVGANDWAGAWATDDRDRPLYACVPGAERQREMAIRFGINLVMYALTGNYKADQVHLPAILERLSR